MWFTYWRRGEGSEDHTDVGSQGVQAGLLPRVISGSVALPVDICGLCYHPGSGLPPAAMLLSEGYAAAGAFLISMICTATWGRGDIWAQVPSRAMSGSVVLLQLRFFRDHVKQA